MSNNKSVEHNGRIESIDGSKINVSFIAYSGCASCHAKSYCSPSNMEEKSVDIYDFSNQFNIGEDVRVVMSQNLGFKAIWLGYIQPLIFVILTLIILSLLTKNEALSGLGSISILIPYYLILYLFRKKLKQSFSFTIKKIE
ncbi:MAG: hypothetical protein A2041_13105 [Bacteroidetes bacterium GWA2_31_9b]|nr:MAG: hypothetical protein A2041_13105 [Bacteroidetes bacterium GWA2_31_9b]